MSKQDDSETFRIAPPTVKEKQKLVITDNFKPHAQRVIIKGGSVKRSVETAVGVLFAAVVYKALTLLTLWRLP